MKSDCIELINTAYYYPVKKKSPFPSVFILKNNINKDMFLIVDSSHIILYIHKEEKLLIHKDLTCDKSNDELLEFSPTSKFVFCSYDKIIHSAKNCFSRFAIPIEKEKVEVIMNEYDSLFFN